MKKIFILSIILVFSISFNGLALSNPFAQVGGNLTIQKNQNFTLIIWLDDCNLTNFSKEQLYLGDTINPYFLSASIKDIVRVGSKFCLEMTFALREIGRVKLTQISIGSEVFQIGEIVIDVVEQLLCPDNSFIAIGAYCDEVDPEFGHKFPINKSDGHIKKIVYNLSVTNDWEVLFFSGLGDMYKDDVLFTEVEVISEKGSSIECKVYEGYYTSVNKIFRNNFNYKISYIVNTGHDHYILQPFVRLSDKYQDEYIGYILQI